MKERIDIHMFRDHNEELATVKIKCPKCSSKELVITEVWSGHCIEWITNATGLFDRNDGNLSSGDPYKIWANCKECDHSWRVRGAIQITDIIK